MSYLLWTITIAAALAVCYRIICTAANMIEAKSFVGGKAKFYAIALGYSLIMGGALGTALQDEQGTLFGVDTSTLLLLGLAMLVVADRRQRF